MMNLATTIGDDVGMAQRVLLIDDDEVDALILRREFEHSGAGIELHHESSADAVLQSYASSDPLPVDLILLDLSLPGMDGFAFLQARKKHPELADVPVIMTTSSDGMDDISRAFELGAIDYFVKSMRQGQYELLLRKIAKHTQPAALPA